MEQATGMASTAEILLTTRAEAAPARSFVLLEANAPAATFLFDEPVEVVTARDRDEVGPALARLEAALKQGYHLAGYAGYELGYALEPRLARSGIPRAATPMIRFGVFGPPASLTDVLDRADPIDIPTTPAWSLADYARRFAACRDYIYAGDVYQINLTFPLRGRYDGDPLELYRALRRRQPPAYGGMVVLGEETVVSLSPEIFFETDGRTIRARPMKGTARRGFLPLEDMARAWELGQDEKNRAENLMIVDLLRNDLSRLSEVGSVKVTDLYTVQTYPTLHQMTSGVEARLRPGVGLADLFAGLFPCGSVTGCPKIRAMEIIRELECAPRGVYCGALGMVAPDGSARFNVAIRTLTLFEDQSLVCNVGSAIVADSKVEDEYAECLIKAKFLTGATSS